MNASVTQGSGRVLWLANSSGISGKMKNFLAQFWTAAGIPRHSFYTTAMPHNIDDTKVIITKNRKPSLNPLIDQRFRKIVDGYISKINPSAIVVNDVAALLLLCGQHSLNACRGSVYEYKDIPVIVIDALYMIHTTILGNWIMLQDMQKLNRWLKGKQRVQPKFEYKVCYNKNDLLEAQTYMDDCIFIATDIETTRGTYITCIGFTGLTKNGGVRSYVIPFINPTMKRCRHWITLDEEVLAWKVCKTILQNDGIKVMQNGSYDNSFFVRYGIAPKHYLVDTMHLMHALWPESIKKLNFISSIFLDFYRYWKDEIKGSADSRKVRADAVPQTTIGMEFYWRYNALDCYNTLMNAKCLLELYQQVPWFRYNYDVEFSTQVGPYFAGSTRGILLDRETQSNLGFALEQEASKALKKLRIMIDMPSFNPRSPDQVASLLYDVLGAPVPKVRKKGKSKSKTDHRSTSEEALKLVAEGHPIYKIYIDAVYAAKKPQNNISKYITARLTRRNRFMYGLNCAGTETWRCNSGKHAFWVGTNAQNIPEEMRGMLIADPGYILIDMDYSQSDAVFMAYESESEGYIANVESDKDTHCLHGAFFFKEDYDHFFAQVKNKVSAYADKAKGFRAITKRLVHGTNFQMQGYTLYIHMGKEAVVKAAQKIGAKDAHLWSRNRLVEFCTLMSEEYHKLYPELRGNLYKRLNTALREVGAIENGFGMHRVFFGKANDGRTQRQASAFIGQSDTASNINRACRELFYGFDPACKDETERNFKYKRLEALREGKIKTLEDEGFCFLLQVHDSIVGQIPYDKLYLRQKLLTIMQKPVTMFGRTFSVPATGVIGLRWGETMIPWQADTTIEEVLEKTK